MDDYEIFFARSARRELEELPERVGERVLRRIEGLATAPRPPGCRKLTGTQDLWRLRVGAYRVVYSVDDEQRTVDVIAIRHRRDAYR
jgi:mRNA interferase RelE/StbE